MKAHKRYILKRRLSVFVFVVVWMCIAGILLTFLPTWAGVVGYVLLIFAGILCAHGYDVVMGKAPRPHSVREFFDRARGGIR